MLTKEVKRYEVCFFLVFHEKAGSPTALQVWEMGFTTKLSLDLYMILSMEFTSYMRKILLYLLLSINFGVSKC